MRIPLSLSNGRIELTELCLDLGVTEATITDSSVESIYAGENALLQSGRVIPLFHLRYVWGLGAYVQDWASGRDGSWNLPNVWVSIKP